MNLENFGKKLSENLGKVIIGKNEALELIIIGLLSQGHILIEDVPGVGKTVLARSLAKSLEAIFRRIQFTPDMLPSDVTGVSIYNQETRKFEYRPGPLLGQIILADEINRATPKTQAALLEAMEEKQITVDGITHQLPRPFMVLATQNPIEYEGTFPLPEAQLDRFLLHLKIGYPGLLDEIRILEKQREEHPIEKITPVFSGEEVLEATEVVKQVYVSDAVKRYIVELTSKTRKSDDVHLGASPRGSLALFRTGQARAALRGRDYVLPDDVKALAVPVLGHRIILSPAARMRELTADQIVKELTYSVSLPGGDFQAE